MSSRSNPTIQFTTKTRRENPSKSKSTRRRGGPIRTGMTRDLRPVANSPKAEASPAKTTAGRTPSNYALFEAIRHRRYRQALLMVEAGVDVNARNERGQTPLTYTSTHVDDAKSRSKFTRLFMEAKADPNIPDWQGLTVLMQAAIQGQTEMIRPLLANAKTDPNFKDPEGNTALMYAASVGNVDVVSIFVNSFRHENRAQYVGLRNKHGLTALQMASRNHHETCVRLLTREAHQFPTALDEFPEPSDLERSPTPGIGDGDDGKEKNGQNNEERASSSMPTRSEKEENQIKVSKVEPKRNSKEHKPKRNESTELNNLEKSRKTSSSLLSTERKNIINENNCTDRNDQIAVNQDINDNYHRPGETSAVQNSGNEDLPKAPKNDCLANKIVDTKGSNGRDHVNGIHHHQQLYKNGRTLYKEMQKGANNSNSLSSYRVSGKHTIKSKKGSASSTPPCNSVDGQILENDEKSPHTNSVWHSSAYGHERSPLRPSRSLGTIHLENIMQSNILENWDSQNFASFFGNEKKRGRQEQVSKSSSEIRGYSTDFVDENVLNSTMTLHNLRSSWERETASWLSDNRDCFATAAGETYTDKNGRVLSYARDGIPLPPISSYSIPSKLDQNFSDYIDCDRELAQNTLRRTPLKKRNVAIKQNAC